MVAKTKKPAAKVTKKAPAAKPAVKVTAKAKAPVARAVAAAVAVLGAGTVLAELATAGKSAAPAKDETLDAYTTRVLNDVAALPDADFGKLSVPAQTWYNAAANALNEDPPAALPELTKVTGGKGPSATKVVKPAATKATPAAKAKKTPAVKVATTARGEGVAHKVRSAVVAKSSITFEDAAKKAGVADAKVGGHAWNIFNEAKRVMELVEARAA